MMLNSGALEIKDFDGRVIHGVTVGGLLGTSANFFNLFTTTLTRRGQVVNLPLEAVDREGFIIIKSTCIRGFNTDYRSDDRLMRGVRIFQDTETSWTSEIWGQPTTIEKQTGEIYNRQLQTNIPPTLTYEEYIQSIDGERLRVFMHDGAERFKIEIKIYY